MIEPTKLKTYHRHKDKTFNQSNQTNTLPSSQYRKSNTFFLSDPKITYILW